MASPISYNIIYKRSYYLKMTKSGIGRERYNYQITLHQYLHFPCHHHDCTQAAVPGNLDLRVTSGVKVLISRNHSD